MVDTAGGIFNPDTPEQGTQNYLGYSRGIVADTSKAVGIEYAGNLIEASAKAADKFTELKIEDEVRSSVDYVQDKTKQAYLGVTPEGTSLTPDEIVKEAQRMEALKEATKQGSIKESYYGMQLDTSAKMMRAKYPGHKDKIDELYSRLTGSLPANRVITELMQEAKKGESPAAREYNSLVAWATKHQYNHTGESALPPDFHARASAGKPYSLGELQYHISIKSAGDAKIAANNFKTGMDLQQNKFTKEVAEHRANAHLTTQMTSLMSSVSSGFAGDFDNIAKTIATSGDKPLSPEDDLKIRQSLGQMKLQWNANIDQVLNGLQKGDKEKGTPDWRYSDVLSTEQLGKLKEHYNKQFDDMTSYLTNKDYGALTLLHTHLRNVQEGRELDVYKSSRYMATIAAIHKVAGKDFLMALAANNPNISSSMQHYNKLMWAELGLPMVGADGKPLTLPGGDPARSLNEVFDKSKAEGIGGYKYYVNQTVDTLRAKETSPQMFKQYAEALYGDRNADFLNKINAEQRGEALLKLAGDPVIFNRLKNEQPEMYGKYKTWVESSLQAILVKDAGTINSARNNPDVDIRYDPNGHKFFAVSRSGAAVDVALTQAINNVNNATQAVKPMYSAEKRDITNSLDRFVRGLAVTVGAKRETTGDLMSREAIEDNPLGRGGPRAMAPPTVRQVAPVLDVLASGEVGGGPNQYTGVYGGKGKPLEIVPDLTNMTLSQVYTNQAIMEDQGRGSTAVGRYQFTTRTLGRIANKLGLDPATTVFDETTQDRLAFELMRERGLDRYMSGRMKRDDFVNELAKEWAAVPRADTGKSHYDGDRMGNKARIKAESLVKALDAIRPRGIKDPEEGPVRTPRRF